MQQQLAKERCKKTVFGHQCTQEQNCEIEKDIEKKDKAGGDGNKRKFFIDLMCNDKSKEAMKKFQEENKKHMEKFKEAAAKIVGSINQKGQGHGKGNANGQANPSSAAPSAGNQAEEQANGQPNPSSGADAAGQAKNGQINPGSPGGQFPPEMGK